jgi:cytochrome b
MGVYMLIKVWDLPTRLFHWLLVISLCGSVFSVFYLEDMILHAYCGYAVLVLLVFRLMWGVYGGHWSRFSNFIPSVKASLVYLRQPGAWQLPGHSPLAAWSVWAMLIVLLVQVASGLCADDDAGFSGPMSAWVSSRTVELLTFYHAEIGIWLLSALIGLHLGAVLFQVFYKRQALVHAMWSGYRFWQHGNPESSADDARQHLKALGLFSLSTALVLTGIYVLQTAGPG